MLEEFSRYKQEEKLNILPKEYNIEDVLRRKVKNGYKFVYHINEVMNRIMCYQKNLPNIDLKAFECLGEFKKCRKCIYKMLNYQQRKSLIYYWCKLNNIKELFIENEHYTILKLITRDILYELNEIDVKKTPEYRLIMYCVCVRMKYDYIIPYLFFKHDKNHIRLINRILNKLI